MSNNPQILSSHLMKLMSGNVSVEQTDPLSQTSGGQVQLGKNEQLAKSSAQSMYETLGQVADKVSWGIGFGAQLASNIETAREKSYREWERIQQGKLDSIETGNILEDELVIGETSYTKNQLQSMTQTERLGLARQWSQTMIGELANSNGDKRHIAWYQGKDESFQSEEGSVRRTEKNEQAEQRSIVINGLMAGAPVEAQARMHYVTKHIISEDEVSRLSIRAQEDPNSLTGIEVMNLKTYNNAKAGLTGHVNDTLNTSIRNEIDSRTATMLSLIDPSGPPRNVEQTIQSTFGLGENDATRTIEINGQQTTLAMEVSNFQSGPNEQSLIKVLKAITLANPDYTQEEYSALTTQLNTLRLDKTQIDIMTNAKGQQVALNNNAMATQFMEDGNYSKAFYHDVGGRSTTQTDPAISQWFDNIPDTHIDGVVASINSKEFFTRDTLQILHSLPETEKLVQSEQDVLYVRDKDFPELQKIMRRRYRNSTAFTKRMKSIESQTEQTIKVNSKKKRVGHDQAKFNYYKDFFRILAQDNGADMSYMQEALSETLIEMYPSMYGDVDWDNKTKEEQDRIHHRNMDILHMAVVANVYGESFAEDLENISPDELEKARDRVYEYIGLDKETAQIIRENASQKRGLDSLGVTGGGSSSAIVSKSVLENPSKEDIAKAVEQAAIEYSIQQVTSTPAGRDMYNVLQKQKDAGVRGAEGRMNALLKPYNPYFNGKGFPADKELENFLTFIDKAYPNPSFRQKTISFIEESRTNFKTSQEAMEDMASAGLEFNRISLGHHMRVLDPIGSGPILNADGDAAYVPAIGDTSFMNKPGLNKSGTSPFNEDGTLVNRVDAVNNQRHAMYIFDIGEKLRQGEPTSRDEQTQYDMFLNGFAKNVDVIRDASLRRMRRGQENFDYSAEELQSLVLLHQMHPVIRAQFYGRDGNVDPNAPGFRRATGEPRSKASASKYLNQVLVSSRLLNKGLVEVKPEDIATVSQRDMARMIEISNRPFILDESTFKEMETAMLLAGERTTPTTAIAGAGGFTTDRGYTGIGYYLTNPELKITSGSKSLGIAVTNSLTMDLGIPSQDFDPEDLADMLLNQVVGPTMAPAFGMSDASGATDEAAFVAPIEFQVSKENGDTEMVKWKDLTVDQKISIGMGAIQERFKNNYTQQENAYTQQIQRTLIQNLVDNFKSKELQEVLGISDTSSPTEKVSAFIQYAMMSSNLGDAPGMFITAPYTTRSSIRRVTENKDGTTTVLGDKQITTTSFNTYPAVAGWSGSNVYGVVGVPQNADYNTTVKRAFLFSTATPEFTDSLLTSDIPEDQRNRFNEVIGNTVGYRGGERLVTNADILYGYAQVFGTQEDVFGRLQFGTGEGKASGKKDITGGSTRQIGFELPTITVQAEQNLRDNKKPMLRITGQDAFELEDVFINSKGNPDYDPTSEDSYLKAKDLQLSQEQIDYILNGDKEFPEEPRGTLTRMGQNWDPRTSRALGDSTTP